MRMTSNDGMAKRLSRLKLDLLARLGKVNPTPIQSHADRAPDPAPPQVDRRLTRHHWQPHTERLILPSAADGRNQPAISDQPSA